MSQSFRLSGRVSLSDFMLAFYDGEELLTHERRELVDMAETIIAHAAHGWPENGPRTFEDAHIHFRPEDFTA